MKKQSIIRILMLVVIITAAVFVGAAARNDRAMQSDNTEECLQDKQECVEAQNQSEFLLESLTRHLLGR